MHTSTHKTNNFSMPTLAFRTAMQVYKPDISGNGKTVFRIERHEYTLFYENLGTINPKPYFKQGSHMPYVMLSLNLKLYCGKTLSTQTFSIQRATPNHWQSLLNYKHQPYQKAAAC